ncbi:hypothetical protein RFI_29840 [Reticulomyxa filosa]|uniref:Kelch motif family protein n=1 Tax=Reticulomyxa filosa TaxID=46433 RepID=X6M2A9_RETFI|nr:hypothetical protein RFI_29840 [Reticulomyxa filosa]|eukprot:ETO07552.1 hypothetical protein RFI_29840 [Reticulomyxa filosa]
MTTIDIFEQEMRANAIPFKALASLPVPLYLGQCVANKDEILICGGAHTRNCYSYHITKNQYKYICSFPNNVELVGHSLVKLVNESSADIITLLSLGGQYQTQKKHTMVMKYISVWYNPKSPEEKTLFNQWIPLTDMYNKPVCIGKDESDYNGVRAIVGGSKNHLLFITYPPKKIDVFNLKTYRYVTQNTLPIDEWIWHHCFVSKTDNDLEIMPKNKNKNEMLLFCKDAGLSIEYNENNNKFRFQNIRVCSTIRSLNQYAYLCVNDVILFFGGHGGTDTGYSKAIHKYSIKENKWIRIQHDLPTRLGRCVGVLSMDKTHVHIIGGGNDAKDAISCHMRINVSEFMKEETVIEKQWIAEEKRIEEGEREVEDIKRVKKI